MAERAKTKNLTFGSGRGRLRPGCSPGRRNGCFSALDMRTYVLMTVIDGPEQPDILHADLDAFYASVEQRDNPALRGIPVAVGGGIVLAASYEAKALGVKTPMNEGEARRRCPHLKVVAPRMQAYADASRAVFDIFHDVSPVVEGLSIDEAFIDVSGLRRLVGPARQIAEELRRRVLDEVGLAVTVGGASTKFLAKVASAAGKPDGLLLVEPGRELEFLHPLPVEALWGVGPKTAERLHERGLYTVAEVAALDRAQLVAMVGQGAGGHLHALAHNQDPRHVVVGRRNRSIGSQRSFPRGRCGRADVEAMLLDTCDRVGRRLRQSNQVARTVTLRLRFGDFKQATRATTFPQATQHTNAIHEAAAELLNTVWPLAEERGLTKVGVAVSNLDPDDAVQMALPLFAPDSQPLDAAVDHIRESFGHRSISRAATLAHISDHVQVVPGSIT